MDLQEIFRNHREEIAANISKGFVNELQQEEQVIEKAIQRKEGDIHPNGKWVWKKTPSGYDWRNIRGIGDPKKGQGSTSKKNESGNDVISIESSKYLLDHIFKMQKDAKGFLYHTDGERVSKETIKNRIYDSKVNSASILDVVGTKGEDKIDRSDMKDDKIAGSYMVKYKEKEDMYDLYKFKVSKKVSDEKQEPKNFKFKVGDSVRIKDSVNMTSLLQHKDKDLKIVQVDKVDMAHGSEILYTFVSERGKEITVSEDNIEKYEPTKSVDKNKKLADEINNLSPKNQRLFAVWCAREALKLVDSPDPRSVTACDVAESYANGKATESELRSAAAAARAAGVAVYAADATRDSYAVYAADAATEAASVVYSASSASYYAINAAARAAGAAARAAAKEAQLEQLKTYSKNFEYKGHTIYTSVDKSGGQNTIIYQTKSVDKKYWDLEKLKEKIDNLGDKLEHNGETIHVGHDTSGGQSTITYKAPSVSDKTYYDLDKLKKVIEENKVTDEQRKTIQDRMRSKFNEDKF